MKLLTILLAAFTLLSPDGRISVSVNADRHSPLSYSVSLDGKTVIADSPIALELENGKLLGAPAKPLKTIRKSIDETVPAIVYKKSEVRNRCNELTVCYRQWSVVFRAYDDGVAYRFKTAFNDGVIVKNETACFNFGPGMQAIVPYVPVGEAGDFESQYMNSFENVYTTSELTAWEKGRIAFNPVAFSSEGVNVCITESNLRHYPGMFLSNEDGANAVKGVFAPYPDKVEQAGYNSIQEAILSRKPYIAELAVGACTPWRVIGISAEAKTFIESDLVYNLAEPAAEGSDWSWVKPGLVSWDWWNDWSLRGVPFYPAVNTRTYEYYIDFASRFGIPYIIMDDGWSVKEDVDLLSVKPEVDIRHIVEYGAARNVGVILWAGYYPFNRDMEKVCRHYSEMGVKGFKVDFMDRDDQPMVEFYERAAATAAKYHLILDFHGAFKPAGLQRTYPNVLNFEGVFGLENMKWKDGWLEQPQYDAQLPFIRQFAGSMDYTPGAMRNCNQWAWKALYSEPMSQGTRCHQIAEYIVFDQPLGMLSDSPSNYLAEPGCTAFIAGIPTVWDDTRAIEGEIGRIALTARRKGNDWYVAALGGSYPVGTVLKFDFLGEGEYELTEFCDGSNANKVASDYCVRTETVTRDGSREVYLASGGGWAAHFRKL